MKKTLLTILLFSICLFSFGQKTYYEILNYQISTPIIVGDTIIVRDSSISYCFVDADSIAVSKTINTAFNNSAMPKETYYYLYNTDNQEFDLKAKLTTNYFNNNNIEETYRYEYNKVNDTWHLVSHYLYDYSSRELLREYYGYNESYTTYVTGSKTTFQYNEQQFLISITSEEMDINTQTLVNDRKTEYQRDINNNDTAVLKFEWINNLWEVQSKTLKIYNDEKLTEEITFIPKEDSWAWTNKIIHSYGFDITTIDTSTFYNWYEDYEFWYIEKQLISEIVAEDYPILIITKDYDFVTETWTNIDKSEWDYDYNFLVNRTQSSWINNEWKLLQNIDYYYNCDTYIDSAISKYFNTLDTTYFSLENDYFNYNSDRSLLSIVHYSKQLESDLTKTHATYYYYSPFVLPEAINETSSLKLKLFPNPAIEKINIHSENELVKLSIYDILGQKILTQSIDNQNATTIDISNLKPGEYLIKAEGKNSLQTVKFIKQ